LPAIFTGENIALPDQLGFEFLDGLPALGVVDVDMDTDLLTWVVAALLQPDTSRGYGCD
jgi:hypothetical protein